MTKLSAIFFLCLTLFGQMFPFPGPGGSAALPNLLIANGHARVIQSLSVGGNHQLMSRSAQVATDNITKLKVALQNFWVNGGVEAGNGGSTTVTASIEYPAGTFTQLKFSGSSSGTIPSGSLLFSDYATVTIPSGATFWVREFDNNASGILLNSWQVSGEALNAAASGLSDQTLGGTITNIGSYSHPPLAIVGPTSKAAVCIVGDSLGFGYNDTDTLLNGDIGLVAKSFPTTLAFANLSGNGLKASNYLANTTARQLIFPYCSTFVSELGTNDLYAGDGSATLLGHLQTIWATFPSGANVVQTTITPRTTSTDSWATTGNQTNAYPSSGTARNTFNTTIRAGGVTGLNGGYFETADVLETSQNSEIWIVTGSANGYTNDGLHPQPLGYALVVTDGAINMGQIK